MILKQSASTLEPQPENRWPSASSFMDALS